MSSEIKRESPMDRPELRGKSASNPNAGAMQQPPKNNEPDAQFVEAVQEVFETDAELLKRLAS